MRRSATRVLVVEDDHFMREALVLAFGGDGFDVRACDDGVDLESTVEGFMPDAVIMDLKLGRGPDGLALTRRLRSAGDVPIIMVSGSAHLEDRIDAFAAGADDFLMKPFSMSELRARLGALLRRSNRRLQQVLEVGDIAIDMSAHVASRAGAPLTLRNIEFQLLAMFCRHPGQVLSKVQILEKVWGYAYSDVNLVEVHVSHLRRELERHGPRVIHTVRSVGYVLQPDRLTGGSVSVPSRMSEQAFEPDVTRAEVPEGAERRSGSGATTSDRRDDADPVAPDAVPRTAGQDYVQDGGIAPGHPSSAGS